MAHKSRNYLYLGATNKGDTYKSSTKTMGCDNPPYAGIRTTLVAAKILNKKFIGIELSEEYIALLNSRLADIEKEKS